LHQAGAIAEAIPLQIEILRFHEERGGPVTDLANAHNYLSLLYTKIGDYTPAETQARRALELHEGGTTPKDHDALACYSMMLTRILALLGRHTEALPHAETALREWALVHRPPSEFLSARQDELAALKAGTWKNPFVA
jgi:tetratricopeptide (TPR) repeat protein